MLRFERPPKPDDFDDRTREARAQVERDIEAGRKPDFQPPIWKKYKRLFAAAQYGKCAYCETKALASQAGAVEHFRPKSAVSELDDDPTTWGREKPGLSNVEGRRPRVLSDRGYWWLAYDWSNLLLACERCNTAWKGTLFPVAERPRTLPPRPDVTETPLLLDPFGGENPADHLRFDEFGFVEAREGSRVGLETIRTLGLDRESLREARQEKARKTFQLARHVKTMLESGERALDDVVDEILESVEMGREAYSHAGMVRTILEQELGIDWSELEASG